MEQGKQLADLGFKGKESGFLAGAAEFGLGTVLEETLVALVGEGRELEGGFGACEAILGLLRLLVLSLLIEI